MSNGYNVTMGQVLEALKTTLLAQDALPYMSGDQSVRIVGGPFFGEPWTDYQAYLRPLGSPEEVRADDGPGRSKFATHTIGIELLMRTEDPFGEGDVVGRTGSRVGITEFVADICEFLENNFLGLSADQLDYGLPPTIEFGASAYTMLQADPDNDIWLLSAAGIYRAFTRSFYRTGTFG